MKRTWASVVYGLAIAGCAVVPRVTDKTASRAAVAVPVERGVVLFSDSAWIGAGCPRGGEAAQINRAYLFWTPATAGSFAGAKVRLRAAGLAVVPGIHHAQPSGTTASRALLLDATWQRAGMERLLALADPNDALVVDLEPYGDYVNGQPWYSPMSDVPALFAACRPWRELGARTLYIAPGHPECFHAQAIAANARAGGATVIMIDEHPMYDWCDAEQQAQRANWAQTLGYGYRPVFFAAALRDTRYAVRMGAACVLYFRAVDDAASFGRDWHPTPLRVLPGDLNCDGYVNFADINPFVQRLSNPSAWQAQYRNCFPENGDCNGDGTVDGRDTNVFAGLLSEATR